MHIIGSQTSKHVDAPIVHPAKEQPPMQSPYTSVAPPMCTQDTMSQPSTGYSQPSAAYQQTLQPKPNAFSTMPAQPTASSPIVQPKLQPYTATPVVQQAPTAQYPNASQAAVRPSMPTNSGVTMNMMQSTPPNARAADAGSGAAVPAADYERFMQMYACNPALIVQQQALAAYAARTVATNPPTQCKSRVFTVIALQGRHLCHLRLRRQSIRSKCLLQREALLVTQPPI